MLEIAIDADARSSIIEIDADRIAGYIKQA